VTLTAAMVVAMPGVCAGTAVDADLPLVTSAIAEAVRQRMAPTTVRMRAQVNPPVSC